MINLHEPYINGNEWKYLKKCLDTGWVSSSGKYVDIFEKKISEYTGSKHAIACVNGTSSLQIALKLAGVKTGDEVIVPSLTFIAPINAIKYNNAHPIFMDNNEYYNIDANKTIEFINNETHSVSKKNKNGNKKITINRKTGNRIAAIIIVHVFGNASKIDKLITLCNNKNIALIEDAAESLGTFYKSGKFKNKHTGTLGSIGCLSFNGNKIITAGGGGMILTNNLYVAKKAKYLTTQAKDDPIYHIHNDIGYNSRLSNIQAALGLAQLELLPEYIIKKKLIHDRYKSKLNKNKLLSLSTTPSYATCNYWLNILEIRKSLNKKYLSKIIVYLRKNNIEVRPIWYPNHLQKKYKNYQTYKLDNIDKIYYQRLCLPSSANLTEKQQDFICSKLNKIK